MGWLEKPGEGAPHTKRGCREDVQLDERGRENQCSERERERRKRRKTKEAAKKGKAEW